MTPAHELKDWLLDVFSREMRASSSAIIGLGIVGGIGLATSSIHVLHLFTRTESLSTTLFGTILPLSLSLVLFGVGLWIQWADHETGAIRIGSWCLAGTVTLLGVSVVSITYQHSKGVLMTDLLFVLTNHATVGAILGTIIGVYDGQRYRRGRELHAERGRVRQLSNRLTILNRVLRHDIRNAVNVIQGNTELLVNDGKDPAAVAKVINGKAGELEAMSKRARRIEQLLEQETIDVDVLDIGQMLETKTLAFRRDHPEVELEMDIPDRVEVRASPLVGTAVDELLENTVKHNDTTTPQIEVSVSAHSSQFQTDGGTAPPVRIRIRDNGPGIPEDEIMVLERGHETDLDHLSGLGLWLVHWVIDESGGEIIFERNEPRGSTVVLGLPSATEPPES